MQTHSHPHAHPPTHTHSHTHAEGKLEAAFRTEAARFCQSPAPAAEGYRYVAFDFHAECGNKRYHRMSLLWDQVGGLCACVCVCCVCACMRVCVGVCVCVGAHHPSCCLCVQTR